MLKYFIPRGIGVIFFKKSHWKGSVGFSVIKNIKFNENSSIEAFSQVRIPNAIPTYSGFQNPLINFKNVNVDYREIRILNNI